MFPIRANQKKKDEKRQIIRKLNILVKSKKPYFPPFKGSYGWCFFQYIPDFRAGPSNPHA
jgi:hypothetical protein